MIETKRPTKDNLNKGERTALRNLRNGTSLVIKPADKGGAIVIMNRSDYVKEGLRQLSDEETCKKLSSDPTQKHVKIITKAVKVIHARDR